MSTQQSAPGTSLTAQQQLTTRLAEGLYQQLGLPSECSSELIHSMVSMVMTGDNITDDQVQSFLIVAKAHGLNPWLKEIHAAVDKAGRVLPIVGVDGWVRIITSNPDYDGEDFLYNGDEKEPTNPADVHYITCTLHRKSRSRPTRVTEYMKECKGNSPAWAKTPTRMLRHRALMQAARLAFGIGGIHTDDEADFIMGNAGPATATDPLTGATQDLMPASRKTPAATQAPAPAQQQSDVIDVESRSVADAPAQAAAATPPPPPPPPPAAPEGGELASDGHKANLEIKAKAAGTTLAAVAQERGYVLEKLTMTQFSVLRAHLMSGKAGKG